MKLELTFRDSDARQILYYLRARYKSKAGLEKLCKLAIRTEVAAQAKVELEEAERKVGEKEASDEQH